MIEEIKGLPSNLVGFRASGEVTEEDFRNRLIPRVEKLVKEQDELNYLLVLDTPLSKFTAGAWLQDAWMGLKHLLKWHKAAIITDSDGIKTFTAVFSVLVPGEFKGFSPAQYDEAVKWAST